MLKQFSSKDRMFLFTKNEAGEIIDFFGPVAYSDIDEIRRDSFREDDEVVVIDEEYFKVLFAKEYYTDFRFNWPNYIGELLKSMNLDYSFVDVTIARHDIKDDMELEVDFTVIHVNDIGFITNNGNEYLEVRFLADVRPKLSATIADRLSDYCQNIFKLNILDDVYICSRTNMTYSGEAAYNEIEIEKLYKEIILN